MSRLDMRRMARALALIVTIGRFGGGASAQDADPPSRKVIGLALSGGSARGMAHAGVLQWLEEHRVPVDRIAGNSTGALMGASYAVGLSAAEIQDLLRLADWDTILRPDIPYALRSYRRKEDDRDYAVGIEAGLRHGLRLQAGLNPGHHLGLLISRILLPYSAVNDFDDLPIPFRCVATDLEKGESVVFEHGPIAPAVRASMSLPGTYEPVRIDGRLYADGGILDNVPVDVTRRMGAEVVIAVRVGPKAEERPSETITGVANRAISLMMQALERPGLLRADVVIVPDLEGLSAADFRRSDELAARGYRAAEAHKAALMNYALDEESWKRYRAKMSARALVEKRPLSFVEVRGVSDGAGAQISQQLSRHIGASLDPGEIELDLNRIIGLGRYASATYGHKLLDDTLGLGIDIREKSYGPPLVRFAVEVNNEGKDINLNLGSRITLMDVTGLGSEWRIDTSLGSTLSIGTDLHQPIGGERPVRGGAFLNPHAAYTRTSENLYSAGDLVAIYGRQRAAAGVDVGWDSGGSTRLRAGYDIAYVRNTTRVGNSPLPRSTGAEQALRAAFDYDGRDAAYLARRGLSVSSTARWFLEAPRAARGFGLVEGAIRFSRPIRTVNIASLTLDGGATFGGSAPFLYQFSLGGPLRLAAFPPYAFRGPQYLLGGLSYRIDMGRLPKLVGGRLYLDALMETGSVFDTISQARLRTSFSLGVAGDTVLGPAFAGASLGQDGSGRVYFMIGRLVR